VCGGRGKLQRKSLLGRRRHREEDNIKLDIQELRWGHGLERYNSG